MVSIADGAYRARMFAARFAFLLCTFTAACTSEPQPLRARPVPELPDLVVSGSCSRHEDTLTLAVIVDNRGQAAAAPSATRVEFDTDSSSGVTRRTRFIAAHAVDTFELELPSACTRAECRWKITVDSANDVRESDEANNTFAG